MILQEKSIYSDLATRFTNLTTIKGLVAENKRLRVSLDYSLTDITDEEALIRTLRMCNSKLRKLKEEIKKEIKEGRYEA